MIEKKCSKCEEIKPENMFYFHKGAILHKCKTCYMLAARAWYAKNKEKARLNQKKHYGNHWYCEYREKKRLQIKEYNKEYYQKVSKQKLKMRQMANPPQLPKIGTRERRSFDPMALERTDFDSGATKRLKHAKSRKTLSEQFELDL